METAVGACNGVRYSVDVRYWECPLIESPLYNIDEISTPELYTRWEYDSLPPVFSPSTPLSPDTADKAEASLMLHSISELREHQPEEKSVNRNGALPLYHTLALLHTVLGDKEKVSFSQSEFEDS